MKNEFQGNKKPRHYLSGFKLNVNERITFFSPQFLLSYRLIYVGKIF